MILIILILASRGGCGGGEGVREERKEGRKEGPEPPAHYTSQELRTTIIPLTSKPFHVVKTLCG